MRQRLAAGEQVARMYQEPGLAWLECQAEVAEDLVARAPGSSGPLMGLWPTTAAAVKQNRGLRGVRRMRP